MSEKFLNQSGKSCEFERGDTQVFLDHIRKRRVQGESNFECTAWNYF
jgi:hypothetical protein